MIQPSWVRQTRFRRLCLILGLICACLGAFQLSETTAAAQTTMNVPGNFSAILAAVKAAASPPGNYWIPDKNDNWPVNSYSVISAIISIPFDTASFLISASAGPGGTISPAGQNTVTAGSSHVYSIIPDRGYRIANVTVDGNSLGSISSYEFFYVSEDHTIEAAFTRDLDYFGMQPGNYWEYNTIDKLGRSRKVSTRVTGIDKVSFPQPTIVTKGFSASGSSKAHYQKFKDGLGLRQVNTSLGSISFKTPVIVLKNPVVPRMKWVSKSTITNYGFPLIFKLEGKVSAKVLVKLPKGWFWAFPINYRVQVTGPGGNITISWKEWFVPYVGTVQAGTETLTAKLTGFKTCAGTISTPLPVVESTRPASGIPGSIIKIKGYHFGSRQGTSTVSIGGSQVEQILQWTGSSILCVVPPGAKTGAVVITGDPWTSNRNVAFRVNSP